MTAIRRLADEVVSGWIGVDLDGTLAEYYGWVSETHIGPPIPVMVERVRQWVADGWEVRIFTARVDGGQVALADGNPRGHLFADVERIKDAIRAWCREHLGFELPITNIKDFGMLELWDDRCVQVEPNTGRRMDGQEEG